jgi:c-di-GMP-binding flagellar brake protein YcgR
VADRRHCLRFEILGRLRGTLATEASVRLRDLSACGVQIEAPWPLPIDSVHRVRLESDTQLSVLDARVRHVRAISERDYVIGLEFVTAEPAAQDHLHRIVSRDSDGSFNFARR